MFFIGFAITSYPLDFKPEVMDIPNHMSMPGQSIIILYTDIIPYTNQTGCLSEIQVFKDASLSKLNNTIKNNSIFITKRAVLDKMVGYILNFLSPHMLIELSLQSLPTIAYSDSVIFHVSVPPPYLFTKPF